MKSLRALLTLLLVALWPLATSHCNLEQLPGFEFLACASEADDSHPETDCKTSSCADGCASVESGFYKTEDAQQAVPASPLVLDELLTTIPPKIADPATLFGIAPSELPRCWQFSFRTALPPRAPSFVS